MAAVPLESAAARQQHGGVLEMRAACERCDVPLPPDSTDAFVCSFECTWCRDCATGELAGRCPNCSGELVRRPMRTR